VHALHVVEEVVATREAVTWNSTLTVTEVAEVRSCPVAMHAMSLTLVAEEASRRRKLNTDAGLLVATEWLQVRVHVLARQM
jgi:hypothetical protein